MENIGLKGSDNILEDISYALLHNEAIGDVTWYVDLTEGRVVSIQEEYTREDRVFPLQEWEKECIRETQKILKHELVEIDPEPKYVSFGIMEDFIESCSPKQQTVLLNALRRKHPFSNFRQSVDRLGILQNWYDFKNDAEHRIAEKWLYMEDLAIQDGRIVKVINEEN